MSVSDNIGEEGEAPGPAPGRSMADILATIRQMVTDEAPAAPPARPASFPDDPAAVPASAAVLQQGDDSPLPVAPTGAYAATEASGREPASGELTVEALVRQALEPMLRQWLDENLHGIIEEVVEREIRRLGRER
jgi:cell pole-organizing protein PopZ